MKTKARAKSAAKNAPKPKKRAAAAPVTKPAGGAPRAGGPGTIRPLGDRVLLRRLEDRELSPGGIVIPDTAQEKPQQAEVIAVGPGRLTKEGQRIAPDLKKGDRVLIGKYSGTDVRIRHDDYVIVREDEVFATLGR